MMTVRRHHLIVIGVAVALWLTACAPPRHWNDASEAQRYLLDAMDERYGLEFTLAEGQTGPSQSNPLAPMIMRVAPVGSPTLIGEVQATPWGPVEDTWSVNLFRDQLVDPITAICADYSDVIESCIPEPHADMTAHSWDPKLTLEEYVKQTPVDIWIRVSFTHPDPDADAAVVTKLIERFHTSPAFWRLSILNRKGVTCFGYDWNTPAPSVEEIASKLGC